MRKVLVIKAFIILTLSLMALILGGCGGGSSGTGDIGSRAAVFNGKITDQVGKPIDSATISLAETGDQSVTDSEGTFRISTILSSATATLIIEKDKFSGKIDLGSIGKSDSLITVEIELDQGSANLSLVSVSVKPLPGQDSSSNAVGNASSSSTSSHSSSKSNSSSSVPNANQPTPIPLTSVFKGTLLLDTGAPVPGAKITLKPGSHSSITNSSGRFSLSESPPASNVQLNIQIGSANGEVTLRNLPTDRNILVQLQLAVKTAPKVAVGGNVVNAIISAGGKLDLRLTKQSVSGR